MITFDELTSYTMIDLFKGAYRFMKEYIAHQDSLTIILYTFFGVLLRTYMLPSQMHLWYNTGNMFFHIS